MNLDNLALGAPNKIDPRVKKVTIRNTTMSILSIIFAKSFLKIDKLRYIHF